MRAHRLVRTVLAAALIVLCVPIGGASATPTPTPPSGTHVPVYAYFYQWFETNSWRRAKQDFPLVGQYSSDDPHVLRDQIDQARWAGINGFLTSWKSTGPLNRRLELLLRMATLTKFDVGVVYEALDFYRKPLPIAKVRSDLKLLVNRWGTAMHSAFGRPLIIWTGTNEYTRAQIASVHAALGDRAYLLAASKNVPDYRRIADLVDGEAYYWSSADPRSHYTAQKLAEMAKAVHAQHGIWICPAAPGFDGRPLGHTRVIDRADGSTFALSLRIAERSSPDAIGVISWNEWSENTYVEPGQRYGRQELNVLHSYTTTGNPMIGVPRALSDGQSHSGWTGLRASGILVVMTGLGIAVLVTIGRRPGSGGSRVRKSHSRAVMDSSTPVTRVRRGD
jgi:Glycosyl hydrolase family 99